MKSPDRAWFMPSTKKATDEDLSEHRIEAGKSILTMGEVVALEELDIMEYRKEGFPDSLRLGQIVVNFGLPKSECRRCGTIIGRALVRRGYAEEKKMGGKRHFRITEAGKKALIKINNRARVRYEEEKREKSGSLDEYMHRLEVEEKVVAE